MKPAFRRFYGWFTAITLISVILLATLYLFRSTLVAPHIQRFLQDTIESRLGIRLNIASIGGSYFRDLVLTDVTTLKSAAAGPLVELELKHLRVAYNLLSLLKGLNVFLGHAAIELDGARLAFDLSLENGISQVRAEPGSSPLFFLPDRLPQILIRDTAVLVRGSGYGTAFKGIEIQTVDRRPTTSTLRLRISEWSWYHPTLQEGRTPVSAVMEYSRDNITVKNLSLKQQVAEFVQVGLKALPEMIPFNANLSLAGGRVALDGKMNQTDFNARIAADHFDLTQLFSIFSPPKPRITGIVSLKADVRLPWRRLADMAVDLDLKLARGNLYGLAADHLVLRAAAKDGTARLNTLDLQTGANRVEFREVNVPLAEALDGNLMGLLETAAGQFLIDCRDVPSLLLLGDVNLSQSVDSIPPHRLVLHGEARHGDIILSDSTLAADRGYIHLASARIGLPTKNRPLEDSPIAADLRIDLPDLGLLSRIFAIAQLGGSVQGSATVTGTPAAPNGTASLTAKAISFQGVAYGDLTVEAEADSHKAVVESVALQRGKDRLTGQGTFHYATQELEDAAFEFQITDLSEYAGKNWPKTWQLAGGKPRIRGSLGGKLAAAGPVRMPRGRLDLQGRKLNLEDTPLGDAVLRLHSDGQRVTVETLEINQSKDRVALKGSVDLSTRKLDQVQIDIAVADIAAYTRNLLPKERAISASIRASFNGSGPLDEPDAQAAVNLKHLTIDGIDIPSASFKARSSGRRISIDRADIDTPWSDVKLTGNLLRGPADVHFDLELTTLNLSGHGTFLDLAKPGHIRFARTGELSLKQIFLRGPAGSIRLDGTLSAQRKADLEILLADVNSKAWLASLATDRVQFSGLNARINLSGTPNSPDLDLVGDLASIGSTSDPISLSGRFDLSYVNQMVTIRRFEWIGRRDEQISVNGTIPIDLMGKPAPKPGALTLNGIFHIPDLGKFHEFYPGYVPLGGSLRSEFHIAGTWKAPTGTMFLQCRGLKPPVHVKPMPPGMLDLDGRIRLNEKQIVVETIRIESPGLTFTGQGRWDGSPALTDLFHAMPRRLGGDVVMTANLKIPDLSWIAEGTEKLRRVAGSLEADLAMEGSVSEPRIHATVRIGDGELRPDIDIPSLQSVNIEARLTPQHIQLETFRGAIGGAPFSVTGDVKRNQDGTEADLQLQGENLLFYRSEGLKLRADTDLTVKGPISRLELAGEVAITDGYFGKYFDFLSTLRGTAKPKTASGLQLFSIRKPPLKDMRFDVRITSKNPFRIRNNLVKGSVRPELKLSGTGALPILIGKVYVDPTRFNLPSGSLRFESGVVRFDETRPDRPMLDLMAESRMFGYDISVTVEGPYDEPVVTLTSSPPLSNEELLLMLLTGQQPKTTGSQRAAQRRNINVAMYIGRDLIARWFGSDSESDLTSIVDRFDIEVGRAVTRAGDETINTQFRLAEGVLREGDTLYITGEKDIFDFYNVGVKIVFRFK